MDSDSFDEAVASMHRKTDVSQSSFYTAHTRNPTGRPQSTMKVTKTDENSFSLLNNSNGPEFTYRGPLDEVYQSQVVDKKNLSDSLSAT